MRAERWSDPCAQAIDRFDWSLTPLGDRDAWPNGLKLILGIMFRSAAPKLLLWGGEFRSFYNEAFLKSVGTGIGPHEVGSPLPELLPDLWRQIGLSVQAALDGLPRQSSELNWPVGDTGTSRFCFTPVPAADDEILGVLVDSCGAGAARGSDGVGDTRLHRLLHDSRADAMATMAMTLAHELNQPLSAVTNYINTARRVMAKRESGSEELLQMAQEELGRAGDVVRRAKSLVRLGVAQRTSVSIAEACRRASSLLAASGSPELDLTVSLSAGAERVLADEVQLDQVLVNLLRNAAEASLAGARAKVSVTSRRTISGRVRIEVRDFGPGFPIEVLNKMFEQIGLSSGTGLGVGLALSRTLVEANRGKIDAYNAEDGGAVIQVDLDAPEDRR